MKIINYTKQTVLASDAILADTVFSRLKGLLGQAAINPGPAMIITQCRSIHMFFMKFSIDAVFVDKKNSVVGLVEGIRPFQMSPYFWRSSYVIEVPPGTIKQSQTEKGDRIVIEE